MILEVDKSRLMCYNIVMNGHGGKRLGAGRKKLPANLKKNRVSFWLTVEEQKLVKQYIEEVRYKNGKR